MKIGILIVNLGTPDAPTSSKVRRYLREFLSDPRVLDIPSLGRWLLLNLVILPFRPRKSAEAYAQIWTGSGSPLLEHTRAFTERLRAVLPGEYAVEFAMRYGDPSIAARLQALLASSPDRLIVFPMYPQYSSASTGSSLEKVFSVLGREWNIPPVSVVGSFYGDPGYLDACAALGRPLMASLAPDHVLFSYHGLPERQIRKGESLQGHCLQPGDVCCASLSGKNNFCYRAQCFETSRQLASRLGIPPSRYSICFQSRLGRTPWIKPFTDQVLPELARAGKKKLLVFSPSFTADCLETLEEIAMRAKATFQEAGGQELVLVPALNSSEAWIRAAREIILKS